MRLTPLLVLLAAIGSASDIETTVAALETTSGGRLGIAVLDTGSSARFNHKADERFPMCSTFKFLAAAAVLARVDQGSEQLNRQIAFGKQDLLEYAPVTKSRADEGRMSLADLCDAAVTMSDNTAGNLLLAAIGGPAGLTTYLRSLGDRATRLDRNEPSLNEATPGDVRDTTTPSAMVENLRQLLLAKALSPASREKLIEWLLASKTGATRLRAGLPIEWRIGDKTGSGRFGTTNDVAIVWPPGRAPLLLAVYLTETSRAPRARDAALAEVARLVVTTWLGDTPPSLGTRPAS